MGRGHVTPGTFSDVQVGEVGGPLQAGAPLLGLWGGAQGRGGWGGHGVRLNDANLTPFPPTGAGTPRHLIFIPHPSTKVCKCRPPRVSGVRSPCKEPTASVHPQSPVPHPHSSCYRGQGGPRAGGTWPQSTAGRYQSWEKARANVPSTSL